MLFLTKLLSQQMWKPLATVAIACMGLGLANYYTIRKKLVGGQFPRVRVARTDVFIRMLQRLGISIKTNEEVHPSKILLLRGFKDAHTNLQADSTWIMLHNVANAICEAAWVEPIAFKVVDCFAHLEESALESPLNYKFTWNPYHLYPHVAPIDAKNHFEHRLAAYLAANITWHAKGYQNEYAAASAPLLLFNRINSLLPQFVTNHSWFTNIRNRMTSALEKHCKMMVLEADADAAAVMAEAGYDPQAYIFICGEFMQTVSSYPEGFGVAIEDRHFSIRRGLDTLRTIHQKQSLYKVFKLPKETHLAVEDQIRHC